jgi:hypothetical protein
LRNRRENGNVELVSYEIRHAAPVDHEAVTRIMSGPKDALLMARLRPPPTSP